MRLQRINGIVRLVVGGILFLSLDAGTAHTQIVINEIHYNPDVKTELVEFVELHNSGSESFDLSGWSLTDAVAFRFPESTALGPGGYAIVSESPSALSRKFGVTALGPWMGKLSNEGDRVVLRNRGGEIVDEVDYGSGFPWPTVGDPPGNSIQLVHPSLDNNLGGSWRSSNTFAPGPSSQALISDHSEWRYFKGTREASNPRPTWRSVVFDDSNWLIGTAPIGYGEGFISTQLSDMRGNYSTVFMRKQFRIVSPEQIASLQLEAQFDDGFNVWINGRHVLGQNMSGTEVAFDGSAISALESLEFHTFDLPPPGSYLVAGVNVIAVQGHNASLNGSSDFFVDFRLSASSGASQNGPTPGRQNSVFAVAQPPQVRQVNHSPKVPRSNQPVNITARITDPNGISNAQLHFQIVDPGAYIELTDPSYETKWQTVAMNDSGREGDLASGDDIFSATLAASIQAHRRLIRYRITVADSAGETVVLPYADDPQPNFAYYVYDGVPGWRGAVRPGGTAVVDFAPEVMGRLPVYQLISKKAAVESSTWRERYGGDQYKWSGTLVYDGEVYDHIRYRARGGVWRYAMGKNMWKFDFNRGHSFRARDDYGSQYKTRWAKLNLGASIQQGDYLHRGEQGMFESVGFRLFNMVGVEAPRTTFVTFRIVDDAIEADTVNQYQGDFWGVYLATEQMDGRFLEEHDLPDGNLFKMENGTGPSGANGEFNNQGSDSVSDYSDLVGFRRGYENSRQTDSWFRSNLDLWRYYGYQAIIQGIHHYDVCCGKNYFYYNNPATGLWQVHPWDLDLTWADNMYVAGVTGGTEPFQSRVLPRPAFALEYRNRVREIRDLLFNEEQAWRLIDEFAALLQGSTDKPTILDADRSQWDYNPVMNDQSIINSNKAGQGRYYQKGTPAKDFAGMVQLMKNYVTYRSSRILDPSAADILIPSTPVVSGSTGNGAPINRLEFRSSSFQGESGNGTSTSRSSIRWRAGEIAYPGLPGFDASQPRRYEINAVWMSEPVTSAGGVITVPPDAVRIGHHYRVRAQVTNPDGRTSHWSEPIQITVTEPDAAPALIDNLRLSELMYNPVEGGEFEFIELHNTSSSVELDLSGAMFTRGIAFSFPYGAGIPPGGYLLIVKTESANDFASFRNHYGLPAGVSIMGPYSGSLANEGERITLRTALGGTEIIDFSYKTGGDWPGAADGTGASIVPLESTYLAKDGVVLNTPENWRASAKSGGSPGSRDDAARGTLTGPLDFGIATFTTSELVLEFRATANTAYAVEFRNSLSVGSWITLTNVPPQIADGVVRVTDSNLRTPGVRFYRVAGGR